MMKHSYCILTLVAVLALAGSLQAALAQVPARISYQGLVLEAPGAPLTDGTYRVTFRLYTEEDGIGQALWSETQAVPVHNGLLSTMIGLEQALNLPFDRPYYLTMQLEGQPESERIPLSSSAYAFMARNVPDSTVVRSISGLQDAVEIVAGEGISIQQRGNQLIISVGRAGLTGYGPGEKAGAGWITEEEGEKAVEALLATLGPGGSNTGLDAAYDAGRIISVDGGPVVVSTGTTGPPFILRGFGGGPLMHGYGSDGGDKEIRIDNDGGIRMYSDKPSNQQMVLLRPNGSGAGGDLLLYDEGVTVPTVVLQADGSGLGAELRLYLREGSVRRRTLELEADGAGTGAEIRLYLNDAGTTTKTIELEADGANDSGVLRMFRKGSVAPTIEMIASEASGEGSSMYFRNAAGDITVEIDAQFGGDGRVITEELEITGGSDLSENFDITGNFGIAEPLPGMVVTIDPDHPGQLTVSGRAYDRMVAGVVSGAGGIETGLIMGQSGSVADGEFPVALTGRVYVYVDAAYGAVHPGDLLTTSATPGHAMKVADYAKSQGAVLGKAMTGLSEGRGLVLVLVSLQ